MGIHGNIAIIHNLPAGGALRIVTETNKILSNYYRIKVFSPPRLKDSENNIEKVVNYLIYIYKTLPEYYKRVAKKINKCNFRAVVIHPDSYLKSPTALFYLNKKTIYILHEPPRELYEPLHLHAPLFKDKLFSLFRIPILFIDKAAAKKATFIITNSKFSKNRIDKLYGVNSYIIYPGVNTYHIKGKTKRKNICVSVGSLLPYKGHDMTISAIALLRKKPKLLIIGNGRDSDKKRLIDLAKTNKVDVKIKSNISDSQLYAIYKSSKVYVNSAYKEPFGMTSLEALSHGMNLVTVDQCGTEELKMFYGHDVVVTKRNSKFIAEGIEKMLISRHRGQKIPTIFRWNHFVNQLMEKIEK